VAIRRRDRANVIPARTVPVVGVDHGRDTLCACFPVSSTVHTHNSPVAHRVFTSFGVCIFLCHYTLRVLTCNKWCKAVWRFLGIINFLGLFAAESAIFLSYTPSVDLMGILIAIFLLRCLAHHRQNRTWRRIIWLLFLVRFFGCSVLSHHEPLPADFHHLLFSHVYLDSSSNL
jgi:hypothetical protein